MLFVFSDASKRVMAGERLRERRPYGDIFNAALRLIVPVSTSVRSLSAACCRFQRMTTLMSEAAPTVTLATGAQTTNGASPRAREAAETALRKFVVVRFAYSPPSVVADFFTLAGCRQFVVPDELPHLIAHLHGVRTDARSQLEFPAADRSQLETAIRAFTEMRAADPNYLAARFVDVANAKTTDDARRLAAPIVEIAAQRTASEYAALADRYEMAPLDGDDAPHEV